MGEEIPPEGDVGISWDVVAKVGEDGGVGPDVVSLTIPIGEGGELFRLLFDKEELAEFVGAAAAAGAHAWPETK
jgi:hypothetical protein